MAVYQVDIQKHYQGEYWTNVWYVDAASLSAASGHAADIVDVETSFHLARVDFDKVRVSTIIPLDFSYITQPLTMQGQWTNTDHSPPLFNVVRADLFDGVKRPGRKYFRGCLTEAIMNENGALDGTRVAAIETFLMGLVGSVPIVSREGNPITNIVVFPRVHMRQLRRGSKRKTQPVI